MTTPNALSPDVLLAHESFVRTVVRGVLRDESLVQDAVQDTMVEALRTPAASVESPRGWLAGVARNRAFAILRGDRRRRDREDLAVDRDRSVESPEEAHARLETHSIVVESVLGLDEPFRTVVVMRYFQGLSPTEIGRRLERDPGTVRSQLNRAHAKLRDRLDSKAPRAQWAALGAPGLTRAAKVGAAGRWVWTAAAAVVVGAVTTAVLRLERAAPGVDSVTVVTGTTSAATPAGETEGLPALATPVDRTSPAVEESVEPVALDDLLAEIEELRWALARRLLRPSAELEAEYADLVARDDAGLARMLVAGRGANAPYRFMPFRGGGMYYSFATEGHDYDREPDVSFSTGSFRSGFYGSPSTLLVRLGDVDLDTIPTRAEPAPGWMNDELRTLWGRAWEPLDDRDARYQLSVLGAARPRIEDPQVGETFLVRMQSVEEHDHLVAFRLVARDEYGCTIAWRRLHEWPVENDSPSTGGVVWSDGVAESEHVAELDAEAILARLVKVRREAQEQLLAVPEAIAARYRERAGAQADGGVRSGIVRLLHRGRFEAAIEASEGGAYYSFANETHEYQSDPDLGLTGDSIRSGFAGGDRGFLLDLGELGDLELRSAVLGIAPGSISDDDEARWDFLWGIEPVLVGHFENRELTEDDEEELERLGLENSVPIEVGHTYLLRTALHSGHDDISVFTVLDRDDDGVVIAWHLLEMVWVR